DRTKRGGRVREARENDRVAFVVDGLSLAAIVERPGSGILIVAGSREFRGSREFCRETCRAVSSRCENVPSLRRDKLLSLLYPRTQCLSRSGVYSNRPLRGDGLKMVDTAGEPEELPPVDSWISKVDFRSTAEVKIPERLVDQVIGQEHA